MGRLFEDGVALTFNELMDRYGLNRGQFITHPAVLAIYQMLWGSSVSEPPIDVVLTTILTCSPRHHRTTNIYCALNTLPQPCLPKLRASWEADLQIVFADRDWLNVLLYTPASPIMHNLTICSTIIYNAHTPLPYAYIGYSLLHHLIVRAALKKWLTSITWCGCARPCIYFGQRCVLIFPHSRVAHIYSLQRHVCWDYILVPKRGRMAPV